MVLNPIKNNTEMTACISKVLTKITLRLTLTLRRKQFHLIRTELDHTIVFGQAAFEVVFTALTVIELKRINVKLN